MSSLTTTTINTINGTTDLTMMTGNSSASAIVLATDGTMKLKANSTLNAVSISATSITTNTATFTSNGNFTASGNVSAVNIAASANVSAVNIAASGTVNADIIDVASNTLYLGTTSVTGSNGYTYLPNGLKMNWGVLVAANTATGTTATFTSAFTQAPYVVTVSHQGPGRIPAPSLVTSSAGSCTITSGLGSPSGTNVHFIAIGI
jgi:hypothetical protein